KSARLASTSQRYRMLKSSIALNRAYYTNPTSGCVFYFPALRGNRRPRVVLRIGSVATSRGLNT
ncbi:hypothetical protein, partial [Xenorhabdus griffiniae]|uniref:hypothetical protein n=1 Tax=Xenorhabdus griffiniae TaxID=351672 RepID=UPI001F333BFF